MEKRHKTTRTLTLSLTIVCTKLALVAVLFIPFLATMEHRPQKETVAESLPILPPVIVVQKPPPRELLKIYSIVRSHRPDITEEEAWRSEERRVGKEGRCERDG